MQQPSTPIATLLVVLRERGIAGTVAFLVAYLADRWFDLRNGTDTTSWARLQDLACFGELKEHGVDYQPTYRLPLRRLLQELDLPKDATFLDLGSGKGKCLLVAAEQGFEKIRGVEFSSALCGIARENWERYRGRIKSSARFEVVEGCAYEYRFRDESIIFLFNPFDDVVLNVVIRNLLASLRENPRPIWILYRRPVHREILETVREAHLLGEYHYWGSDFVVFSLGLQESPVESGEELWSDDPLGASV